MLLWTGVAWSAAPMPKLAILEFNLVDTSGEALDQMGAHEARLRMFVDGLRKILGESGKMAIVNVACGNPECMGTTSDQVSDRARKSGAEFLLLGTVHKMSTLVLSVQVEITDLRSGSPVYERFFSFRGDTDEAWRHAASFVARDILAELPRAP